MSKPEQAQEPTMEEILASIRRIISDDTAEQDNAEPEMAAEEEEAAEEPVMEEEPAVEEPVEDDDVLELTEEVSAQEAEALIAADSGEEEDVIFQEKPEEPQPEMLDEPEEEPEESYTSEPTLGASALAEAIGHEQPRLLSPQADASVASAFASLENFVLSTHSRTLEDLVSEMLRPMLKGWLDANLPQLTERLVREEIERVTRGRR